MLINALAWLLWLFNYAISKTLSYEAVNEPSNPVIFAAWHGQLFPLFYWARHRKICVFPTEIWRGETIAYTAKKYGYKVIRFKEKGSPFEVGRNVNQLKDAASDGYDVTIAVDGPPRPLIYRQAKPGVLFISRTTGIPIVPVFVKMPGKIVLFWRWDKYEIPLPWSRVQIIFGRPFVANRLTTTQEIESRLRALES